MYKIAKPDDFRNNVRQKLHKMVDSERISENIEKGVFNFSIHKASEVNIVRKWDNTYFVQIYVDRLREAYTPI